MRNSLLFFKLAAVNQAYLAREGALLVNVLPLLGFLRDLEAEADALVVAVKLAVLPDVLLRPDKDVLLLIIAAQLAVQLAAVPLHS